MIPIGFLTPTTFRTFLEVDPLQIFIQYLNINQLKWKRNQNPRQIFSQNVPS